MSKAELSELMKRDKKLQAVMGQRELTQAEKDEWENLVQQITLLQEEMQATSRNLEP